MSSQNKKNKAKNSYMINGGEKNNGSRYKRFQYFTKQDRKRLNNDILYNQKGE